MRKLAERLGVSEKTANDWLKLKDDEEDRRLRPDNKDRILKLALDLDIEPERFAFGPALWDCKASWEENLSLSLPAHPRSLRPFVDHAIEFLGHRISSPIGVWGSSFTANAARVKFFALSGADVLTYKAVGSQSVRAIWPPNVYAVSQDQPALSSPLRGVPEIEVIATAEPHGTNNGVVASFGYPSTGPEYWQADFRVAQQSLRPGQLLILSVRGTCCPKVQARERLHDWANVCELAAEAGARIIELDLAKAIEELADVAGKVGLAVSICKIARKAAPDAKILVNFGYAEGELLSALACQTAGQRLCDGFTISTIPVRLYHEAPYGREILFNGETRCLTGPVIVGLQLQCVAALKRVRERENLPRFAIVAAGSISTEQEFTAALYNGADVVQVASACYFDSYVPFKLRKYYDSQARESCKAMEGERDVALINFTKAVRRIELDLDSKLTLQGRERLLAIAQEEMLQWLRRVDTVSSLGPMRPKSAPTVEDCVATIQVRFIQR
ncbi:MAG TPA: hypothetical protein VGG72_27940 [Bryobacteraceae bacterium]